MSEQDILLARQPIYDSRLNTYAYELLFRSADPESGSLLDGDQATSLVILNTFSEIGLENVIGDQKAFINFTHNLLKSPPPLSADNIVIEVLEDVLPEPEILDALQNFKNEGFTIALDDFIYEPALQPLVELANIIKIDVLEHSEEELIEQVNIFEAFNVKLLAEKVETQEMFELCKKLGFDYFQGYFLSRPKIIKGQTIPANKLIVMQLMTELQKPNIESEQLHDVVSRDPALSYKLLRMINSAAYRRPIKVESLLRAILLIGPKVIKQWASLLVLSHMTDKPHALKEQTMIRAHVCEKLGGQINPGQAETCFTVGMFSTLDAFFDTEMEVLLESVSLADEIHAALINREGLAGFVLTISIAYERGKWGDIPWAEMKKHGLSISDIKAAYLRAINLSQQTSGALIEAIEGE